MGYLERIDAYKDDMLEALAESVSKPSVTADPVRTKDGELAWEDVGACYAKRFRIRKAIYVRR